MNNFNNFNNQNNPFMNMPKGMQPQMKRTHGAIKLLIVFFLGIIPFILCAAFIIPNNLPAGSFNQWPETFPGSFGGIDVSYGIMWLIGIAVYIVTMIVGFLLGKYVKGIELDIIPLLSAASLAMLNLFVIPHSDSIFMILSLPSFALIGFIIGTFIMMTMGIRTFFKEMNNLQNNESSVLKDIQNSIKKQEEKKDKTYEDNPFVDVKNDEDEDDEED